MLLLYVIANAVDDSRNFHSFFHTTRPNDFIYIIMTLKIFYNLQINVLDTYIIFFINKFQILL